MRFSYEIPEMEIIQLVELNVVTASGDTPGLNGGDSSDGDSGGFEELFPELTNF